NVGHGLRPWPTYTEINTASNLVGRTRRSRGRRDSAGCDAIRAIRRYAVECWPRPAAVSNLHGNQYERQLGRSALGEAEGDGTAPDASPSEQSGGTRWNVGHGLRPCPTYTEINTSDSSVGLHSAKPRATGQRRMRRHQSNLAVRDGMLATAC